jgi:hypothetical protein
MFGVTLLSALLLIVVSIILWFKAPKISKYVSGNREENLEFKGGSIKEMYILGLTIVGVIIVVTSLPLLVMSVGQAIQYIIDKKPLGERYLNELWLHIGTLGFKLLLGLFLVLRAEGIYGMIKSFRDLGLKHLDKDK